jgi:hypothetical protein
MSNGADAASSQHVGLEGRSFARLQRLIGDFPSEQFRPPIRAATNLLLNHDASLLQDGGVVALELPRRTVWLRHSKTFNPTGPGSASIDLFDVHPRPRAPAIASMVRKTIFKREPGEEQIGWLGEALFYFDVAPRLDVPGLVVPQLYGCKAVQDKVTMIIEYLQPAEVQAAGLERIDRAAGAIGRLGAISHKQELYGADWIRPVTPRLPPETLFALEALTAHCIDDPDEQGRIVTAIENLIGSPDVLGRIRERAYPCLAHGDLHVRNVFTLAGTMADLAVIDWGKVFRGAIGQDAVLLLLPRYIASAEWGHTGFSDAVEHVQQKVIAGALSVDASLDPERIRLGLDIGLVFQAAVLAAKHAATWTQGEGRGPQVQRRARIASMLRHVAERSEALLRQHSV